MNTSYNVSTGCIVWMGPSSSDGAPLVAILTFGSDNRKTGNMAQLWILRRDIPPTDDAAPESTCGSCPQIGACYVLRFKGPGSVYRKFSAGGYPIAYDLAELGRGRRIRLGAYGDPAMVPYDVIAELISEAAGWTGYTHQRMELWCDPRYREILCASCDSETDWWAATAAGWQTFRVRPSGAELLPGEFRCPAELGRTCADCLACAGARGSRRRAGAAVVVHGARSGQFNFAAE